MIPKTVVPIGYVGVVVSYYGKKGADTSGRATSATASASHEGEKGVWDTALGPGKYAFNTASRPDRAGADHQLRAPLDHRPHAKRTTTTKA